jgi:hypothetical protein
MIQHLCGMNGVVIGGGQNVLPYAGGDIHTTSPGIPGEIKVIGSTIHVWANGVWTPQCGVTTIELTPEAQRAIEWAQEKMRHEQELEQLIEQHQSIKDTKLQLDVLVALLKDSRD